MRKLMRHTRTGKIAVYDADLIESGRWEPVDDSPPSPDEKPAAVKEAAPKKKRRGSGGLNDQLQLQENVSIVLFKGDGTTQTYNL